MSVPTALQRKWVNINWGDRHSRVHHPLKFSKMKTVLVLLVALMGIAAVASVYSNTDGKPNCTAANVKTGKFRNNFDPTRYWLCEVVGKEASVVLCPAETGYVASLSDCVSWAEWVWEEPVDPPTA